MTIKTGDKVRIRYNHAFNGNSPDAVKNRGRRNRNEIGSVTWVSPSVNQIEVHFSDGSHIFPEHALLLVEPPFKLGDTVVIKGPVLHTDGRETDRILRNKYEGKITQLFPNSAWVRFPHPYGEATYYGNELPFDRLQIRDFPKGEESPEVIAEYVTSISNRLTQVERTIKSVEARIERDHITLERNQKELALLTRAKNALEEIK